MKAVCIKSYYDKELHRTVTVGDEIELSRERFDHLSTLENDAKTVLVKAKEESKTESKRASTKKG